MYNNIVGVPSLKNIWFKCLFNYGILHYNVYRNDRFRKLNIPI